MNHSSDKGRCVMARVKDSSGYRPMWLRPVQYKRIARAAGNTNMFVIANLTYKRMAYRGLLRTLQ